MKISRFTTIVRKEGYYLLHNTLFNSIMRVYGEKSRSFIDSIEDGRTFNMDENSPFLCALKKLNMIVDELTDELATLNSLFYEFERNSELYVMLIVTRRCNFRCAYCYEEYSDTDMSNEVFRNVLNYVIGQIERRHYKNVYISFFGGEPTLMSYKIIDFMKELQERNSRLQLPSNICGIITTNGYLLTKNLLDKFLSCNIIRYQITVDGLEEDHDSSRYLSNGQGTWNQIIGNLYNFKSISNSNVSVLLRTNVTPLIYEHIDEWLEFIHDNFSEPVYRVHFEAAKDFGKMNDQSFGLLDDETSVMMDIIDKAKHWNLPLEIVGFNTLPFSMICYAARQLSFIVDYDGTVKKCTSSALDDPANSIGQLNRSGMVIDIQKSAQWTSYELSERCKLCKVLPICYRRKCPVAKETYDGCELINKVYLKGLEYFYTV